MNLNSTKDLKETSVDTLTYDQWAGVENTEQTSAFIQFMSSHDLIFVVLGVSLIIWFVLLFFMFTVDRKVSKLEKILEKDSNS
jgi:type IV secretory pathway VirB6-like protein